MSGDALRVLDAVHTLSGTTITVAVGALERELALSGLGEAVADRAVRTLRDQLEAGASLDDALRAIEVGDIPGRTQRRRGVNGCTLLDDTRAGTPEEVRGSLRVLADLGRGGLNTVAVIGPLLVDERDRLEEHDALGRIVVRLDISQLVVIGHGARHLYMAASLEGSWDGESVLFDDAESAYDFVRATTGPNTVIMISGGAAGADLAPLVAHLQEVPA